MAHYQGTINVDATPEEAFDYLARFSNAEEWDPGVARASMATAEPVGLGSTFDVIVRSAGRELPFRYEIIKYDRARRAVLRAERGPMVSEDTVTIDPLSDGATKLTYDADLRLTGALRIFDPLLAVVFGRIGKRGLEGLRDAFESGRFSNAS